MKDFKYQQKAITELIGKTIDALNLPGYRRKIVLEAPTGAGKTVIACQSLVGIVDELKEKGDSRFQECAFIWFAPRKLHIQSYNSLKDAFKDNRKLVPVMFDDLDQSEGIQPGQILFVNWESINKDKNVIVRDNESSASLYEITRRTQEDNGLPIVAIIDEEHMFWSKTADKSAQVLERINPKVEIRISATPKTPVNGTTQRVLVERSEVINAGMIKKEVVLNPDIDVDSADSVSIDERLLRAALHKREQIAEEYEKLGVRINPLLLIQLPNDVKGTTSDDEEIIDLVKQYLRLNTHEQMTVENGKLAVWLANEKSNLDGLEEPDNMVKALLFKEAIALGWDCPRAAVLLIYRKLNSDQFTIQTVGRILRMPQQHHYTTDLLNVGYVYTDIAKDKIKIVTADQSYIWNNPITATRRVGLHNVSLPSVYASRPNSMHNYLGPDFKKTLYDTAAEMFRLEQGGGLFSIAELAAMAGDGNSAKPLPMSGDLQVDENRRRVERQLRLDVRTVNVEIPKDVHFQNEVQELSVEKVKFARTPGEIDRAFLTYVSGKGGQFESRQGDRTQRIAAYLLAMIEDYFNIFDTDAKKVVLYHENKPVFDHLLDRALELYARKRSASRPSLRRLLTSFDWEVPEERMYDRDTNHIEAGVENHAMEPFVQLNEASNPEKSFESFLERNSQSIDWWYKNGDKGRTHYAIPFDNGSLSDPLFYPDFVIRLTDGRICIFDTKTKGSDLFAVDKHNALIEYIRKENARGANMTGGIIINQPAGSDVWLYSPRPIESTTDLTAWQMLSF